MQKLSAVIITFNEARNIGRCLDSLADVVDEVVVVDSFSTDETEAICRAKGARFFQHVFEGFAAQKNWALEQAQFPYVLSLDADEAVSKQLRESILAAKKNWEFSAYALNRRTNYCGQWINHSGWYPDRKLRLFDRRHAKWGGPLVHERLLLTAQSSVGFLKGDLLHYSYFSVEEHYARVRKYALLAAQERHAQGKRSTLLNLVFSPAAKFIRNYVFRLGFLDGRAGFTICRIAALETYLKYRELRRLQKS
jgi:glycosyltransferase involved in cell wall biosynthesis